MTLIRSEQTTSSLVVMIGHMRMVRDGTPKKPIAFSENILYYTLVS